jgi:hypothetical protein
MDWLEILSADYRVRDMMTGRYEDTNWKGDKVELCSAPVMGDTVYLRLSKQGNPDGIPGFEIKSLKVIMDDRPASKEEPAKQEPAKEEKPTPVEGKK